jgi:hypothetical protein
VPLRGIVARRSECRAQQSMTEVMSPIYQEDDLSCPPGGKRSDPEIESCIFVVSLLLGDRGMERIEHCDQLDSVFEISIEAVCEMRALADSVVREPYAPTDTRSLS